MKSAERKMLPIAKWNRRRPIVRGTLGGLVALILAIGLPSCSRAKARASRDHLAKGEACVGQRDWNCAQAEFAESARLDPRFAGPHYELARVFLRFRDNRRAYDELRTGLDLDPGNQAAQIQAAALQLEAGDLGGVKRRVDTILKRDPSSLEGHLLQAKMLMRLDQAAAARAEIQRAMSAHPNRPEPYVALGVLEQSLKNPEAAEVNFKRAMEITPPLKEAQVRLGRLYAAQNRWSDAERVLQSAVASQPDASAFTGLVTLYLQHQELAKAEETARHAGEQLSDDPTAYRLAGNLRIAAHDIAGAAAEYQRLLALHPEDPRVRKNYSQLLILQDQADAAHQLVTDEQRADPFDEEPMLQQAELNLNQGTPQVAQQLLESVLARQPNNAIAHFYLGLVLRELLDYGGGDRELRESEKIQAHSRDIQSSLVLFLNVQDDVDILNTTSEKIAEAQPLSVSGYARAADVDLLREHFDEAEADLKKAIAVAPRSPLGYSRMGALRMRQQRPAEAEQFYRQALDLDPGFAEAAAGMVEIYKSQGQEPRAVTWLEAQIAKVPASSSLQVLRGQLYLARGNAAMAEQSARKGLDLNKSDEQAYLLLSRSQEAQGNLDQALATAQSWVNEKATAASRTRLGEVLDRKGQWQKAQDSYRDALKIDEGFTAAANDLALSLMQHEGNLDVAITYAEIARSKAPLNPQYADTLGWAYYMKGSYRNARPLLEEAVGKLPQNASSHYHLAMTYKKLADTAMAEQYLKKALQIDPNFPEAEAARHNLQVIDPTVKGR